MTLTGTLTVEQPDDAVDFVFTVSNDGPDRETLDFRSGFTADFAAETDGEERWRWSEGKMFMQALQSRTLDPGESVTYEGTWTDPEPGTYTAIATLQSETHELEARDSFSI